MPLIAAPTGDVNPRNCIYWIGQAQAVRGGQPKMRTKRTFRIREGAFWATTRQCAGEC